MQRINRQNTMLENYLIPLAGTTPEERIDFYCNLFNPYSEIIYQFQAALLLHNIPLYILIIFLSIFFIYITYLIEASPFPTLLFFLSLIPLAQLARELGSSSIFKSLIIELPQLPADAPNRIRNLEEIFDLLHPPFTFFWRLGFFIYKSILCPNLVDTFALFLIIIGLGVLLMIIRIWVVLTIFLVFVLAMPTILTRKFVYDNVMYHLGHPFPELEHQKED